MHDTAMANAKAFVNKYVQHNMGEQVVLDVGSLDLNGSLREIFEGAKKYIGLDVEAGENVDVVASSHAIPLGDDSVDVVVSSSCFEHDPMFWLTFLEMCRVVKPSGYIYINSPSNGPYHGYPGDCWRFYADSWKSLAAWGVQNNYSIELTESYIDPQLSSCGLWNDSVGIFQKH